MIRTPAEKTDSNTQMESTKKTPGNVMGKRTDTLRQYHYHIRDDPLTLTTSRLITALETQFLVGLPHYKVQDYERPPTPVLPLVTRDISKHATALPNTMAAHKISWLTNDRQPIRAAFFMALDDFRLRDVVMEYIIDNRPPVSINHRSDQLLSEPSSIAGINMTARGVSNDIQDPSNKSSGLPNFLCQCPYYGISMIPTSVVNTLTKRRIRMDFVKPSRDSRTTYWAVPIFLYDHQEKRKPFPEAYVSIREIDPKPPSHENADFEEEDELEHNTSKLDTMSIQYRQSRKH